MRVVIENLDPKDAHARRIAWALKNLPHRSNRHPLDLLKDWGGKDR